MTEQEFRRMNAERHALIDRALDGALTERELARLDELDHKCVQYMDAHFPRPFVPGE